MIRRPPRSTPFPTRRSSDLITDLDPLQHELIFERFLNPERISLPDIDIDFCMNRRGEVINYVTNKYGRENVDRKSTRLNSSHVEISYAVFCLKKKKTTIKNQ